MSKELILMLHPTFGALAVLAAVWAMAETVSVSGASLGRIRGASTLAAVLMWATFLVGGYWYVMFYGADKALIKAGPWPFAHSFFMEAKEHVFLMLLLLATYLPIAAAGDLVRRPGARRLVLWIAALVILMVLAMEGAGAFITMGLRTALMPH